MTTLISSLIACNGRGARGGGSDFKPYWTSVRALSDSCAWVSVCAVYVPCIFRVLYGQGCRNFYEESAVDFIIGRKMWGTLIGKGGGEQLARINCLNPLVTARYRVPNAITGYSQYTQIDVISNNLINCCKVKNL